MLLNKSYCQTDTMDDQRIILKHHSQTLSRNTERVSLNDYLQLPLKNLKLILHLVSRLFLPLKFKGRHIMKKSSTIAYLCLVAGLALASPCSPAANPSSPEPRAMFQNFPGLNITVRSPFLRLQVLNNKEFRIVPHGLEPQRDNYHPRKQDLPLPRHPRK